MFRWIFPVLALPVALFVTHAHADVEAFDVGGEHACALDGCGEVQCWGYNGYFDELEPQSGDFIDVAVGTDHNCALEASGQALCWGRADDDRLEPPVDDFVDLEAGGAFTCGIRTNGEVACWGWEGSDPDAPATDLATAGPPLGKQYREVALSYDSGCAITSGRSSLYCWGAHVPGGVRKLAASDVMQSPGEKFKTVSLGYLHACFVSTHDRVYCFGRNSANQLMPDHALSNPKVPGADAGEPFSVTSLERSVLDNDEAFAGVMWGGVSGNAVLDVSAGTLGTCASVSSGGSPPYMYCWGFPFQYGYGRRPLSGVNPDEVLLGGHQFCGWTRGGGGSIDCRWEFPANATLYPVPDLTCS